MAELAYAGDSNSPGPCGPVGSSPTTPTITGIEMEPLKTKDIYFEIKDSEMFLLYAESLTRLQKAYPKLDFGIKFNNCFDSKSYQRVILTQLGRLHYNVRTKNWQELDSLVVGQDACTLFAILVENKRQLLLSEIQELS